MSHFETDSEELFDIVSLPSPQLDNDILENLEEFLDRHLQQGSNLIELMSEIPKYDSTISISTLKDSSTMESTPYDNYPLNIDFVDVLNSDNMTQLKTEITKNSNYIVKQVLDFERSQCDPNAHSTISKSSSSDFQTYLHSDQEVAGYSPSIEEFGKYSADFQCQPENPNAIKYNDSPIDIFLSPNTYSERFGTPSIASEDFQTYLHSDHEEAGYSPSIEEFGKYSTDFQCQPENPNLTKCNDSPIDIFLSPNTTSEGFSTQSIASEDFQTDLHSDQEETGCLPSVIMQTEEIEKYSSDFQCQPEDLNLIIWKDSTFDTFQLQNATSEGSSPSFIGSEDSQILNLAIYNQSTHFGNACDYQLPQSNDSTVGVSGNQLDHLKSNPSITTIIKGWNLTNTTNEVEQINNIVQTYFEQPLNESSDSLNIIINQTNSYLGCLPIDNQLENKTSKSNSSILQTDFNPSIDAESPKIPKEDLLGSVDYELKNTSECKICRCQAGRHFNFYGCKGVCTSCRSFFRRSVLTGHYKTFTCKRGDTKSGSCNIDSQNRKSCKKCRFQRCTDMGMKPSWIHPPEEVKRNDRMTIKVVEGKKNDKMTIKVVHNNFPMLTFTSEETNYALSISQTFSDTMFQNYCQVFASDQDIVKDWIQNWIQEKRFSYELLKKFEAVDNMVLTMCALKVFDQLNLSSLEQVTLLQSNVQKFIAYSWAIFCIPSYAILFTDNFIKFGQENKESVAVNQITRLLEEFNLNDNHAKSLYKLIFPSPWAPNPEIERQHKHLIKTLHKWSTKSGDDGDEADPIQTVLFDMILWLTVEDTNLYGSHRTNVESLQMKFILMLQRYLRQKYPTKYNSKLATGMILLQYAKEFHKLHSLRMPI